MEGIGRIGQAEATSSSSSAPVGQRLARAIMKRRKPRGGVLKFHNPKSQSASTLLQDAPSVIAKQITSTRVHHIFSKSWPSKKFYTNLIYQRIAGLWAEYHAYQSYTKYSMRCKSAASIVVALLDLYGGLYPDFEINLHDIENCPFDLFSEPMGELTQIYVRSNTISTLMMERCICILLKKVGQVQLVTEVEAILRRIERGAQ